MKILVTGGAGFIGSNIVDSYILKGHRVWVVDNESTGRKKQVNKKACYQKCDIRNKGSIRKIFQKGKFDIVNHHAAQIDVRSSVNDPVYDAEVNILGLLNILTSSVEHKVKKVIFSSSGGTVYGETMKPATETSPECPLSPYGVAKLSSEKYIQAFHALFGLKYTIFRYSNVYGPRQDPHGEAGVVAIFSERLLNGELVNIFGSGNQIRDFVYSGDVARANLLALNKGDNQIFNIGTQRETSVKQLFHEMADILEYKKKPIYKPARNGELQKSVLNYSKAKRSLGWSPQVALKEGLSQTINFFKEKHHS